jgi:hypothetical protein
MTAKASGPGGRTALELDVATLVDGLGAGRLSAVSEVMPGAGSGRK